MGQLQPEKILGRQEECRPKSIERCATKGNRSRARRVRLRCGSCDSPKVVGNAPLQGKLVDVDKATSNEDPHQSVHTTDTDFEKLVVRSRSVAKEFANTEPDDFFSATPPLEALRLLTSHTASGRSSSNGGRNLLVVDVQKHI